MERVRQFHAHVASAARPMRFRSGITPWARGHGLLDVKVTTHQLSSPKLPPLEGTLVKTTDGAQVRLEPLENGTTVISAGMSGMKTVQVLKWLSTKPDLPMVAITPRRNLAYKLEADLDARGLTCHNYLNPQPGVSVTDWCKYSVVIISGEQVT
eukprot:2615178-Prymnesium_polylepis.1